MTAAAFERFIERLPSIMGIRIRWSIRSECNRSTGRPRVSGPRISRVIAVTTKGELSYQALHYQPSDLLILGPETRGLPVDLLHSDLIDHRIRIPMIDGSRSMNLSNAAAVIIYEAWRQHDFLNGY
jgi:tRNA(Leu) C34 or U34 (ribose-2'-O)-methylase TrmL